MTVDDRTLIALIPQLFDRVAWLEKSVVTLMSFIKGHDQEIEALQKDYEEQFTGLVNWINERKPYPSKKKSKYD